MSTVLRANYLDDGAVVSDESGKRALYKFSDKLDRICDELGFGRLSGLQDSTELEVNLSETELPDGMQSTNELMAKKGNWKPAGEARALLESLLEAVRNGGHRFGMFNDAAADVIRELEECIAHAREAETKGAKFNLSVVM